MTSSQKRFVIVVAVVAAALVVAAAVNRNRLSESSYSLTDYSSGGSAGMVAPGGGMPSYAPEESARDAYYDKGMMPPPSPMPPTAGETAAEVDQKIIKNGYLSIVVVDVSESATRVTSIATMKGGFVQSSSVSERGDGTKYGDIVVRVPSKDFETAMSEIKKLATLVKSESSSGQDVTEQYTDLEAQLRNARAQEQVYLEVLKKATTVKDILEVQSYLGNIRAQIEQFEGRLKYLENLTSYSTISVSLSEEPTVRAPTKEFRPSAAIKAAVQAVVELFQLAVIAAIWLLIVGAAIFVPLAILAWILWRIARRFMRRM